LNFQETNAIADKARAAAESQRNAMIAERQRVCGQLEQQLIQAEKTIKARDQDVHSLVSAKDVLEQELSALQSKIATAERNERQVRARLSESSAAQAQLALSEARFAEVLTD
jgi:chromosome segregation ATPase